MPEVAQLGSARHFRCIYTMFAHFEALSPDSQRLSRRQAIKMHAEGQVGPDRGPTTLGYFWPSRSPPADSQITPS